MYVKFCYLVCYNFSITADSVQQVTDFELVKFRYVTVDVNLNEDSSEYICNSAVLGVPLWFVTQIVDGKSKENSKF